MLKLQGLQESISPEPSDSINPEACELQVEERDHEEPREKTRQARQTPLTLHPPIDLGTKEDLRPLEEKQEGESTTEVESLKPRHLLNPGFSQGSKYSK